MGTPKTAKATAVRTFGENTCLVSFESEQDLGFVGGQYIIIDSGETMPNGKAAKRAYSVIGSDDDQRKFELAALRIDGGRCSNYLNCIQVGDTLTFSGPWGKFKISDEVGIEPDEPTLVVATDTGITAALGLLKSRLIQDRLSDIRLVWFRSESDYFLPEEEVKKRLPSELGQYEVLALPAVHDVARIDRVLDYVTSAVREQGIKRAFACGDGAINYPLGDRLTELGIPTGKDQLESFFNMPKKSPSAKSS